MFKKIIFGIFLFFIVIPVFASSGSLVKVGNKYYETFEEALANVSSNDVITLISDVKLKDTVIINKGVNIDLNGNDIMAPSKVFLVQGGTLNINGKGTIKETEPNYGAIMVIGSTDSSDTDYSVLDVGKDVTLEGWSGIFITHDSSKSYGVSVNFAGIINSVDDVSGEEGIGIYVNGNIKDKNNSPLVTILDGAKINSTGNGLYIAGYSVFNINESDITGVEAGIGIKSGILNIDGAKVTGTGIDKTPTEGDNNGIKASGAAIQIESNNGYAGGIELNIDNGTFQSENSNVIYEYIGKGNSSQVIAMDVSSGKFISDNKDVFRLSNSLLEFHNSFISGGSYSTNPSEYLKSGCSASYNNGMYAVTKGVFKDVFLDKSNSGNNVFKIIIILLILSVIGVVLYFNKEKIFKVK